MNAHGFTLLFRHIKILNNVITHVVGSIPERLTQLVFFQKSIFISSPLAHPSYLRSLAVGKFHLPVFHRFSTSLWRLPASVSVGVVAMAARWLCSNQEAHSHAPEQSPGASV